MHSERGIVFGVLGIVERKTARALGFNNDGDTPSFGIPKELGEGEIYHTKPWGGENIAVASVVLNGQSNTSYFLRTFEGMNPIEMDSLNPDEREQEYKRFLENIERVVSPEFRVTPDELKEKLEELSRD